MAITLEPKGKGGGKNVYVVHSRDPHAPGRKQRPNPAYFMARNAETLYRSFSKDSDLQESPMAVQVWDVGKSESRAVMVRIRVET